MTLFPLCTGDPLLDLVSRTFRAQPIRVPEARVAPLVVFSMRRKQFVFIGPLLDLVVPDARPAARELKAVSTVMADVSSRSSGAFETKLGLKILDGFLQGFQMGAVFPRASAQFDGVDTVSFAFHNVRRRAVDPSAIANALADQALNVDNPALAAVSDGSRHANVYIVDSVITSQIFTITAESGRGTELALAATEINQILTTSAGAKVKSISGHDLTFNGPRHLPFAFTCQRVGVGRSATRLRLTAYHGPGAFARPPEEGVKSPPRGAVLTAQQGLLEWDAE